VTRLRVGRPGFDCRQGQWSDIFLFATASRPALGSTQHPILQLSGFYPSG